MPEAKPAFLPFAPFSNLLFYQLLFCFHGFSGGSRQITWRKGVLSFF
jgi:hypothetical protein